MPYLALQEAAAEIHRRTTVDVTAEQLLRLGIAGELLIVSWFSSTMRNVSAHKDEDVLGLLVIPPMHLGDIEFGGEASIQGAFSLDGKSAYAPYIKRTRDQLRIRRSDLESFIARIEKALLEKAATSAVVLEEEEPLPPSSPTNTQPATPETTFLELEHAATHLAHRQWGDMDESTAEETLRRMGIGKCAFTALHALRLSSEAVFRPRVEGLIKEELLPLYVYPEFVATSDPVGAWVNEAELVKLVMAYKLPSPPSIDTHAVDADDMQTITTTEAGHVTTIRQTQAQHAAEQAEQAERQSKGRYTMREVAQILADANGLDTDALLKKMVASFFDGDGTPKRPRTLKVRSVETLVEHLPGATLRTHHDLVSTDDVNKMLAAQDAPYRFLNPVTQRVPPAAGAEVVKVEAVAQPDPQPAPAVTESAPQRRARLLKWLDDEKSKDSYGALSRVVAREKLQKSNADRGNIGSDIRRGRKERATASAAGPFDGLGS